MIDAKGFAPSTLTYWRKRLAASDRPQRIFDVVRDVIVETGAVAGKQRRAPDPPSSMTRSPVRTP